MPKLRPGGRTARTKAAVFEAVTALMAEREPSAISMADIAGRAGVAATSLYRRWGDVGALLMDVAVERLTQEWPLPDTGSLRGDLTTWGLSVARSLRSREGSAFFRIYLATAPATGAGLGPRSLAIGRRLEQLNEMLERGKARGETPPPLLDLTDHLLAPLYMRALFGAPAGDEVVRELVERLLGEPPK